MVEFVVTWTTVIEAESEEEAVKEAWGMMQDPDSSATYFRLDWVDDENVERSAFGDYYDLLYPEECDDLPAA